MVGCAVEDLSLQTSTSEGLGTVLAGLDLGPGDEIVTSDSEHPGLIGPLLAARAQRRDDQGPSRCATSPTPSAASTTLVACSHVSWVTGEFAPAALAELDVPVVLDGAQGAGAVPVDVQALGCAAYAAAGQKWLCGSDGTGLLYVAPDFRERVRAVRPSFINFEDSHAGFDATLHADARRYDTASLSREAAAFSLAATRVLDGAGLDAVHARATRPRRPARRRARRARPHGRAARRHHARHLGGRRPGGHARAARRRRGDRPRPPRHRRTCAPRSAPGTTRATSSGCSAQRPREPLEPDLLAQHPVRRSGGRRRRRLEALALLGRQDEVDGAEHVLEVLERPRADERRGHAVDAHQPRDRHLRHRRAALGGDRLGRVDDPVVALDRPPVGRLLDVVGRVGDAAALRAAARRAGCGRSGTRRRAVPTAARRARPHA